MSFLDNSSRNSLSEDDPWMSVSDLMSGLMVIFLFIAIVYIRPVLRTQENIEQITSAWTDTREEIFDALKAEFKYDLRLWNAELIKESLTIRFRAPDILFEIGTSKIKQRFEYILDSFFPRYLSVLENFQGELEEIRIEGHTSSEWAEDSTEIESYFNNME